MIRRLVNGVTNKFLHVLVNLLINMLTNGLTNGFTNGLTDGLTNGLINVSCLCSFQCLFYERALSSPEVVMCVLCVFCVSELEEDSHDDREAAGAQHLAAHEVDAIEGLPCLPVPLDAASTSTKVIDAAAAIPCTIICCPTRKKTEHIAKHLRDLDVAAEPYHTGLPKEMLAETYAHFMQGVTTCIVATMAFGMCIGKTDVRRIIHYGYPQSIEALHQEIGRAGRDDGVADCILFANLLVLPTLLLNPYRSHEQVIICVEMLRKLYAYATNRSTCCV